MSKSAKGTLDAPGRNVSQQSGLNKAILDQGWGEFLRQIEYKLAWLGGLVLLVNPAYTSQQCSCCGHTAKENRKNQAQFVCTACGFTINADHNAANNIERAGHAQLACQANDAVMSSATGTTREADWPLPLESSPFRAGGMSTSYAAKSGTVESSIIMCSVVLKSSELNISEMPNPVNSEPEKNRGPKSPGSENPRGIVIRPTKPVPAEKIEIISPRVNQVVRNPDCNVHPECRRIDELRRFI